jgi:sugar fermentation stimulation protein A
MRFEWIKLPQEARFVRRLNRFACQVELEGKLTKVYLPNTGRLEELLIPSTSVILEKRRERGKTLHDMLVVQSAGYPDGEPIWVGLDSRLPPTLLRWAIENQHINVFGHAHNIRNEPRSANGRFDLEIQSETGMHIVETKSANLIDATGIARFPDAPTTRGVKHLRSLIEVKTPNVQPWVVFIVMRQDATAFSPFSERDPEFSEALQCAKKAGVNILVAKFKVEPIALSSPGMTMSFVSDLELIFPGRPFPGFWSNPPSSSKTNKNS